MSVIKADEEVCQGYANCVVAAADIFDIGDAGTVVILDDTVAESDEARIVTAIRSCPVSALRLEMV
ncbi:MAG: ferredoxin [Mycobacteriaceae bacterium]|uniref:Ferredoxin n=1 Tax=Mycolicibacterium rhodesiae (strain NBB3) TaxID=710685 RepID=G8RMQ4_MYCRN|nr:MULTISPECIES: ferredoxin [Mycolicibacterium]AEV73721.1 ferredoxin [Mycolicibacterium rhodesiae NBB3]MBY0287425.1 ferredoxin [Mycobacteriaceae bacterium]MDX1887412.1 ferredoxin [Mycolicibacterium sp. 120270]RDH74275.1 ferredoxin [Mycolicibacterium moriokaense]